MTATALPANGKEAALSAPVILLLAATCGLLIANLYFVQPIADLVARDFTLDRAGVGFLTTLPLAGYGAGLLFVVPLGDLIENRRLILAMIALETVSLFVLSVVDNVWPFLATSFLAGLSATAIQVILPYTSRFLQGPAQGKAVAQLVSGMMLGIMLARPASGFNAEILPWHAIYLIAAMLIAAMLAGLAWLLPPRRPASGGAYGELLLSMAAIFRDTELLRRRAAYHAAMFGTFISFWTAAPLWLAGAPIHLSQGGIAWVALAGVAGAIAPPFATRLFDAGYARGGTMSAMLIVIFAMLLTLAARQGSVLLVVVAAILLDGAVSANLVFGQRTIYALAADLRGRMNALYIATFFIGGAIASAAAAWCFVRFGWPGAVILCIAMPAASLAYSLTERRTQPEGT